MTSAKRSNFYPRNPRGASPYDPGADFSWAENSKIVETLLPVVGERRIELMKKVIANRTDNLTIGLENVHDPHNIAAVLRSAEAFGISSAHIVFPENRPPLSKKVSQGAHKWVDLHHYRTPAEAVEYFRSTGRAIYTASFTENSIPFDLLDLSKPAVLFFGNEHDGASKYLEGASDEVYILPMFGFTGSFNISVAAAISISLAVRRRIELFDRPGDLSDERKIALLERWITDDAPVGRKILARAGIEPPPEAPSRKWPISKPDET